MSDTSRYVWLEGDVTIIEPKNNLEDIIDNGGAGSGNHGHGGRPGLVGGSGGGSGAQMSKIMQKEQEIKNNKVETFYAVDENGKVILKKSGNEKTIHLTYTELMNLSEAKNIIGTHNHPDVDGLGKFSSLSRNDILTAAEVNMKEVRVITDNTLYRMTRPSTGWPSRVVLEETYQLMFDIRKQKAVKSVMDGNENLFHSNITFYHPLVQEFSDKLQIKYSKEILKS